MTLTKFIAPIWDLLSVGTANARPVTAGRGIDQRAGTDVLGREGRPLGAGAGLEPAASGL